MTDNPVFYDSDAEKAILGAVLIDNSCIQDVRGELIASDFYNSTNAQLWGMIVDMNDKRIPVDMISLTDTIRAHGITVDPLYLADLTGGNFTIANLRHYIDIVKDKSLKRRLWRTNVGCAEELKRGQKSGKDIALDLEKSASDIASNTVVGDYVKMGSLVPGTVQRIEHITKHPDELDGLSLGLDSVDAITNGVKDTDYVIIGARPSTGKAQPLDAMIKTPDSWIRMGDIKVGDKIASIDGSESYVTGVFPQGIEDVYRITFSDGRSTECSSNHLWQIGYRSWENDKIMSTKMLITRMHAKRNRKRLYIPLVAGQWGNNNQLPIDPWLLGVLIGDGCLCSPCIGLTSADIPIVDKVRSIIAPNMTLHDNGKYGYRIVNSKREFCVHTKLRDDLASLGLYGTNCFTKFIPTEYLNSNFDNRMELLNGLIATDGEVDKNGHIGYSTVSEQLKNDIVSLARSLGGICSVEKRVTHFTYKGEYKAGSPSYRIHLLMPEELKPKLLFLKRHYERINFDRTRENRLTIKSIEYSRTCATQCIMVSHPSQLYITDDYIVTHNTSLLLTMANNMTIDKKIPVGIFSCEMSKESLNRRQVYGLSGLSEKRLKFGHLAPRAMQQLEEACTKVYNAPMYIDDTPNISLSAFRASARKMIRQDGVKAIFIDYLGLMNAENPKLARWERIGILSKSLKTFCRENHVPLIVLSQLSREAQGKKPTLAELRDSGAVEEDADMVFFLHREKEPDINAEVIETELICAKQRNGPVGTIELNFYPALTKFEDIKTT